MVRKLLILTFLSVALARPALAEEAVIAPLGFTAADVTADLEQRFKLSLNLGVVVTEVDAKQHAVAPPLQPGDQLLQANREPILSAAALSQRAATLREGQTLDLVLLRGDRRREAKATAPAIKFAPERPLIAAPLPMFESGGHRSKVKDVIPHPDGERLISAGNDKTVRIWSLKTKQLLRVIRGPSAPGDPGKIFATALSPDGKTLALGGYFNAKGGEEWIRLVDLETGSIKSLLRGHRNVVLDVAFSPDGKTLVSSSFDRIGAIWDLKTGAMLKKLEGHRAEIYSVRFSPDGSRIVTASYDHDLRMWNAKTGALIKHMPGHKDKVFALDIAPDGTVASGDESGEIRLWDGKTGEFLRVLARQGDVGALAFSPNGKTLLATCGDSNCNYTQRLYNVATGEETAKFTRHRNSVLTGTWVDAQTLATAGGSDKEVSLWRPDGSLITRLKGVGRTIWAAAFSADGGRIGWGSVFQGDSRNPQQAKSPVKFALGLAGPAAKGEKGTRLSDGPQPVASGGGSQFIRATLSRGDLSLSHEAGGGYGFHSATLLIKRGANAPIKVPRPPVDGYRHSAYGISPDGSLIISGGGNGSLISYDLNGKKVGKYIGHTGDVWAVTPSPDGRLLVSSGSDQTVRLWNLKTRELLVTIFPGNDGSWLAVTPQGVYDASFGNASKSQAGGAERLGWLLNYGPDKTAGWVTAEQLGDLLYRPNIVARALELASAKAALKEANNTLAPGKKPLPTNLKDLFQERPPELRYVDENLEADGHVTFSYAVRRFDVKRGPLTVTLDAVETQAGAGRIALTPARITPTDAEIAEAGLEEGESLLKFRAPIRSGYNRIRTRISNSVGDSREDYQPITFDGEGALNRTGRLRILAIGANSYVRAAAYGDLRFAVADAKAFAAEAAARLGRSYRNKPEVKLLVGKDGAGATLADIEAGLAWLEQAGPADTTLVFLAGHGRSEGGDYLFLPSDYTLGKHDERGSRGLSFERIWKSLERTAGRKAVFLDACRSAGAFGQRLEHQARKADAGLFMSAGPAELAEERLEYGHGLFTFALLEGLRGAAFDGRELWALQLSTYISNRVRKMSGARQKPPAFRYSVGDMRLAG